MRVLFFFFWGGDQFSLVRAFIFRIRPNKSDAIQPHRPERDTVVVVKPFLNSCMVAGLGNMPAGAENLKTFEIY